MCYLKFLWSSVWYVEDSSTLDGGWARRGIWKKRRVEPKQERAPQEQSPHISRGLVLLPFVAADAESKASRACCTTQSICSDTGSRSRARRVCSGCGCGCGHGWNGDGGSQREEGRREESNDGKGTHDLVLFDFWISGKKGRLSLKMVAVSGSKASIVKAYKLGSRRRRVGKERRTTKYWREDECACGRSLLSPG